MSSANCHGLTAAPTAHEKEPGCTCQGIVVVKLERDVPGLNKDAFKESIKNSGGTPTSLARVGDAAYTYPANMEAVNPFTS